MSWLPLTTALGSLCDAPVARGPRKKLSALRDTERAEPMSRGACRGRARSPGIEASQQEFHCGPVGAYGKSLRDRNLVRRPNRLNSLVGYTPRTTEPSQPIFSGLIGSISLDESD